MTIQWCVYGRHRSTSAVVCDGSESREFNQWPCIFFFQTIVKTVVILFMKQVLCITASPSAPALDGITIMSQWASWLQQLDGLSNYLFKPTSKKTSKTTMPTLCEGNPPVTAGFTKGQWRGKGFHCATWQWHSTFSNYHEANLSAESTWWHTMTS